MQSSRGEHDARGLGYRHHAAPQLNGRIPPRQVSQPIGLAPPRPAASLQAPRHAQEARLQAAELHLEEAVRAQGELSSALCSAGQAKCVVPATARFPLQIA